MNRSAQSPFLFFIISIWNWEALLETVLFLSWEEKKEKENSMKYEKTHIL